MLSRMWQREAWLVSSKFQVGIEGSGKLFLTRVNKDSNNALHIPKKLENFECSTINN